MGYGYYELSDGREAGYNVSDVCNEPGCAKRINRGLGYLCGTYPGEPEDGCGGYYCEDHMYIHHEYSPYDYKTLDTKCSRRWSDA